MQKFNQLGLELVSIKSELLNLNHSDVVRKALLFQAENMTENKQIDVDTHLALTNGQLIAEDFRLFIMEKPSYMKTFEELRGEYDIIRESLLEQFQTDVVLDSTSDVETESISFVQTYELDLEWVKSYFDVKEADIPKLVNEKGFIAKFAVLRFPKVVDEFLDKKMEDSPIVDVTRAEHVYLNAETSSYCMDLVYKVSIDDAEKDSLHETIADFISKTATSSHAFVKEKIS